MIRVFGKKGIALTMSSGSATWGIKLGVFLVLLAAFGSNAFAASPCAGSFSRMPQIKAGISSPSTTPTPAANPIGSAATDNSDTPSIVGLWRTKLFVGNQMIMDSFQIYNLGGTEVHNPSGYPGGLVCLGTWKQVAPRTFKLVHRVWNYDMATQEFLGTVHVTETLTLGDHGNSETGTFTMDFYDPNDTYQYEIAGNVVGTRISVK